MIDSDGEPVFDEKPESVESAFPELFTGIDMLSA